MYFTLEVNRFVVVLELKAVKRRYPEVVAVGVVSPKKKVALTVKQTAEDEVPLA